MNEMIKWPKLLLLLPCGTEFISTVDEDDGYMIHTFIRHYQIQIRKFHITTFIYKTHNKLNTGNKPQQLLPYFINVLI